MRWREGRRYDNIEDRRSFGGVPGGVAGGISRIPLIVMQEYGLTVFSTGTRHLPPISG